VPGGEIQRGILCQDRSLELLKRPPRLEPEPLDQFAASIPIGLQRAGLAPAAVQREHQLAAQPLAQRMLANERLKLAHQPRVLPRRKIRVDPVLQRGQARFLQPRDLSLRKRLVGEIRKRRTPPHPQRLAQGSAGRQCVASFERLPAACGERLEPVDVELAWLDPKHIATPLGEEQPIAQRLTQVRYVSLNELVRARGRLLAPELVDQAIRGNHLAPVQEQHRQQRPLLGRAQRQRAVVIDSLKRPENAKFHLVQCPGIESYHRSIHSKAPAPAHIYWF
jgi:hypothetical protein